MSKVKFINICVGYNYLYALDINGEVWAKYIGQTWYADDMELKTRGFSKIKSPDEPKGEEITI